jgi:hypothetical protein
MLSSKEKTCKISTPITAKEIQEESHAEKSQRLFIETCTEENDVLTLEATSMRGLNVPADSE